MGWRFRSSVKLLPGVRLNFSKSGISTSVGGRGATLNFGPKGTRSTLGIPGSGVSYSALHSDGDGRSKAEGATSSGTTGCGCWGLLGFIAMLLLVGRCASPEDAGKADPVFPPAIESPPALAGPKTVYVAVSSLNGRAEASADAPILQKFGRGEKLDVAGRDGEWVKVVKAGVTMWVAAQYVSDSFAPSPAAAAPVSLLGRRDTTQSSRQTRSIGGGSCSCSSGQVCVGPRGGRYCMTSGGNKRYGI